MIFHFFSCVHSRKLNAATLKSSGDEFEMGTYNNILFKTEGDEIEKLELNGVSGAAPRYDEGPPTDPTAITCEPKN